MTAVPLGPIVPEAIRPLPAFERHAGAAVTLEPLSTRHVDDLWEAARAAEVSWAYLKYGPFPSKDDMAAHVTRITGLEQQPFFAVIPASSGKAVQAGDVDLLVRALSMGKLHHAMMGTAAVAIGTAAAIPGTLVNLAAGGTEREAVRFGHPSGTLRVGAAATQVNGQWTVTKAIMSRSARVLMEGVVRVPGDCF